MDEKDALIAILTQQRNMALDSAARAAARVVVLEGRLELLSKKKR